MIVFQHTKFLKILIYHIAFKNKSYKPSLKRIPTNLYTEKLSRYNVVPLKILTFCLAACSYLPNSWYSF